MMSIVEYRSIPNEARTVVATPDILDRIYAAARNGLKNEALALAAGLRPDEYARLCMFDALAEIAERKGRADAEMELAQVMMDAAKGGDTKAALELLRHTHGWVAKTAVDVTVDQRVSIVAALEQARARVLTGVPVHALEQGQTSLETETETETAAETVDADPAV